jgi:hypothetical protein
MRPENARDVNGILSRRPLKLRKNLGRGKDFGEHVIRASNQQRVSGKYRAFSRYPTYIVTFRFPTAT